MLALSLTPCSISYLASMRGLSLPAMHKHVKILESAGLVRRTKIGRTNVLAIRRSSLRSLHDWITQFHAYWGSDEESLENYTDFVHRSQHDETETT